jgi:hypothetical protein
LQSKVEFHTDTTPAVVKTPDARFEVFTAVKVQVQVFWEL